MQSFKNIMPNPTAAFAALALSIFTISATVSPVDFAAPPVVASEYVA
ncbi:hypothetical protein [Croceicoccus naphthovorans]|nr:hypothetical protein [Croceicoccus naphthovorans]MBB3989748.1 hypothetical protein [Croceicoccus naphthovorans]